MEKNLYIDASHPNETRIVLKSDNFIEEYEFEDKNNLNFKNNIYLLQLVGLNLLFKRFRKFWGMENVTFFSFQRHSIRLLSIAF
jgi:ribonuclease E